MKSLEHKRLVLIGASTGGPSQIQQILSSLSSEFKATVIVAQHMGDEFIPSFAQRLSVVCKRNVVVAKDKYLLKQGEIFIASQRCELRKEVDGIRFSITKSENAHFHPDINQLFASGVDIMDDCSILAIILTGIGDDGVEGCAKLFEAGANCIAESEKSAVVYGMPARAKERIENILVKDLDEIIRIIQEFGDINVSFFSDK